jgi:hypothetical protein
MPLQLAPQDRKILIGGVIALVVLVVGAAILTPPEGTKLEFPTTYSSGSGGAKAAYLLLKESGYSVERWERSPTELPEPTGKVLIIADPMTAPQREERNRLHQFIKDGGRLIVAGMFGAMLLPENSSVPDPLGGLEWKKVSALAPSAITRATPQISLAPQSFWKSGSSATPLYGEGERAYVVQYRYGMGDVIWWASATPLTNAGLKEPGNLEFFLACLGERQKTHVMFDEYFHGHRPTLAASIADSWLPWLFLQLAVLAIAVLFTFSRRSGSIFVPVGEVRLSPLEFVQTLGGLYEHAGAASVAVDISYQRFRYWLTRRLGMASNASLEDLEQAVRERWKFQDPNFVKTLRDCESARYFPDLRPERALELVKKLYDYADKLKLFRLSGKEKD